MATLTYQNLDLLIDAVCDGYHAIVAGSPVGYGQVTPFMLPLSTDQTAAARSVSALSLRSVGASAEGDGSRTPGPPVPPLDFQALGVRLYQAIFAGETGRCLEQSQSIAQARGQGLRIRLNLSRVPSLAGLPWEFMYDATHERYLALSNQTVVVRYLTLNALAPALNVTPPLTVLVAMASPGNSPLNVEQEWQRLRTALADLVAQKLIRLEPMVHATWPALQNRLREGAVHILHFIGHGYFDSQANEGGLLLEREDGHAGVPVSASQLHVLLRDHTTLRLAFLNACEGAVSNSEAVFNGVAQQLVQGGIPAVMAMQYAVTDIAGIKLARGFYEAIADNHPVDAAVAEARKAIFIDRQTVPGEWGTPVLFCRSDDALVLRLPNDRLIKKRLPFEPETVWVFGGPFLMGSEPGADIPEPETPQHTVDLADYFIGCQLVTNAQYFEFVDKTDRQVRREAQWNGQLPPQDRLDQPMTGVTFDDAVAYCAWLRCKTEKDYALPSEAQWEKAARTCGDRGFVWGVAGEWTCSLWGQNPSAPSPNYRYPWRDDARNDVAASQYVRRVIRGRPLAPAAPANKPRERAREADLPTRAGPQGLGYGFRVVVTLPPT